MSSLPSPSPQKSQQPSDPFLCITEQLPLAAAACLNSALQAVRRGAPEEARDLRAPELVRVIFQPLVTLHGARPNRPGVARPREVLTGRRRVLEAEVRGESPLVAIVAGAHQCIQGAGDQQGSLDWILWLPCQEHALDVEAEVAESAHSPFAVE